MLSRLENHFGIELPDTRFKASATSKPWLNGFSPPVMLDLSKYQSIGEALRDALDQYANEVSLIEADREREKERLDLPRFQGTRASAFESLQNGGFSRRRSRPASS